MPTYEVRRRRPILALLIVEAASEEEAEYFAGKLWVEEAKAAAATAEITRQPQRPDDGFDARSEARYDHSDTDAQTEQAEAARWATESAGDGTEA